MPPTLRHRLLQFYDRRKRDLPWRRTRDPYRIWIAETMLQQTQVATVVERYQEFLDLFPSIEVLAAATPERVCEAWTGLGYYQRARNLQAAARTVVTTHGGVLPANVDALKRLPGIGDYTAGAIASIAFGLPEPLVDTNVVRVLSRLFAIEDPPDRAVTRRRLWKIARDLVRGSRPGELNQAIMELGSLVCLPDAPDCNACPVSRSCGAHRLGLPENFPAPVRMRARRHLAVAFAWIETRAGVWLERRGLDGLWAGQWQPPAEEGPRARHRLAQRLGVELYPTTVRIQRPLSHRTITARLFTTPGYHRLRRTPGCRPYPDPLAAPLSSLARKTIEAKLKT